MATTGITVNEDIGAPAPTLAGHPLSSGQPPARGVQAGHHRAAIDHKTIRAYQGNMMQVKRLMLLCVNCANRDLTFTVVHSRDQMDEFLKKTAQNRVAVTRGVFFANRGNDAMLLRRRADMMVLVTGLAICLTGCDQKCQDDLEEQRGLVDAMFGATIAWHLKTPRLKIASAPLVSISAVAPSSVRGN
jgi:hypothetical protein